MNGCPRTHEQIAGNQCVRYYNTVIPKYAKRSGLVHVDRSHTHRKSMIPALAKKSSPKDVRLEQTVFTRPRAAVGVRQNRSRRTWKLKVLF
jgi:hypothetical protein